MDKNKKRKNKTAGLSQSASKSRDVTDSFNTRDTAAPQATTAASSSVVTPDRQSDEVELNRLRQENREMMELKRRNEAEISALRRSDAKSAELLNSLMEVSGGKCSCACPTYNIGC